jgi:hypothetical protein
LRTQVGLAAGAQGLASHIFELTSPFESKRKLLRGADNASWPRNSGRAYDSHGNTKLKIVLPSGADGMEVQALRD